MLISASIKIPNFINCPQTIQVIIAPPKKPSGG